MVRVSIITAYYGNESLTESFLRHLEGSISPDYEVVVVNGGSKKLDLKTNYNALYVNLSENLGFSGNMNAGAKAATGTDYLIFIGNDGFPVQKEWVENLISTAESIEGAGIVCPVADNPTFDVYRHHVIKDYGNYATMRMYPAICWLIPRKVWDEIGEWDTRFGIGTYEDDDYARRVTSKGYLIIVDKTVVIHHLLSQTMGKFDVGTIMQQNYNKFVEKYK